MTQSVSDRGWFRFQKNGLAPLLVVLALAALLGPAVAQAQVGGSPVAQQLASAEQPPNAMWGSAPPSRGLGKRIAGWVLSGLGVVTAGASAICFADFYPRDAEEFCFYGQLSVGGIELVLGITFLSLGYGEKGEYDEWKRSHAALEHLSHFGLATTGQGTQLSYRLEF